MTRILSWLLLTILGLLVLSGAAISAQDKYTVQVPGGLAFSEFKGYENWQVISVSHARGNDKRDHLLVATPRLGRALREEDLVHEGR